MGSLNPVLRRLGAGKLLAASLWLVTGNAAAQVNVEPLREQVAKHGFGLRARASVTTLAGNTSGVIFGSSVLAGVHGDRNVAYAVLSGDYTRLNGAVSVAKWFAHARHNYQLGSTWWWEEYAQLESDRFRRITVRELIGTGPRFGILQRDWLELFYGASYMYVHTALDTAERDSRGEGGAHRFSNYLALTLRAHERISFSSVTYAQPRFDRPSDFTLLSVSIADFTVTKLLHSNFSATVRYESVTPSDVKRADLELKSSIELVF